MNTKETFGITSKSIAITLILGSTELIIAIGLMISSGNVSKNTILFGYSTLRLFLITFAAILGISLLSFSVLIHQKRLIDRFRLFVPRNKDYAIIFSSSFLLLGVIIALIPSSTQADKYSLFFEQIKPILIILTTLPFQLIISNLLITHKIFKREEFNRFLSILFIFASLLAFISYSKLGIKADSRFWNVAGAPLTLLQLAFTLLITLICLYTINQLLTTQKTSPIIIDIGIAILIYLIGIWVWSHLPMVKHFFALRPAFPSFQYTPYSDARDHDLGALSILQGYGINFGEYTDKPFYITFLAILHLFSGNDYNQLSLIHLACMGAILPAAFWFGKNFHSRNFGIAIALILLIRQRNAILLAHLLSGTNPRLLLTEIPTMLGMILFLNITFSWFKEDAGNKWIWSFAFLAGGILAAISLLRLNPLGLLPVILTIIFIKFRKPNKRWTSQILAFTLGFLFVFSPWLFSGQDSNGQPYIWIKIQDVINVRYSATHVQPEEALSTHIKIRARFQSSKFQDVTTAMHDNSVEEFPIFIINHSLHNFVTAFLALPDSLSPQDQDLRMLIKRPYFDEKQLMSWNGNLRPGQYIFVTLNIVLISISLGWAWQRWRWMGILPAIIFVTYTITLGLARSSGSRYIVPVDWIVFLYYLLGIFLVIEKFFTDSVITPDENKYIKKNSIPQFTLTIVNISIVMFLAVLVPIAQIPIITKNLPACENRVINRQYQDVKLLKGMALYPYLEKGSLSFVFLSCNQRIDVNITEFNSIPKPGQTIIVGFKKHQPTIIFLEEKSGLIPVWQAK